MTEFTYVSNGFDWEGIYVDGEREYENHTAQSEFLRLLGEYGSTEIEFGSEEVAEEIDLSNPPPTNPIDTDAHLTLIEKGDNIVMYGGDEKVYQNKLTLADLGGGRHSGRLLESREVIEQVNERSEDEVEFLEDYNMGEMASLPDTVEEL